MDNMDGVAIGNDSLDFSGQTPDDFSHEDGVIEGTPGNAKDEFVAIGGDFAEKAKKASQLETMSFEERIAHLRTVVSSNPLQRELLYKTLKYCSTRRILPDVEESIASYPEFSGATQSPYYLLLFLVNGGGIDAFDLDEEGNA
ncbi:MAG: hypothetical protein LBB35_00865, partial [Coriobacteriaceae bacterium]|nr:hypothetical protein [Coriobacteriaceae bacterium]